MVGRVKEKAYRRLNRLDVYDIISMLIIAASLLFSVYRFLPVATRVVQAVRDFGLSVAYYFTELSGFEGLITPTVTEIPTGMNAILPEEWLVFKEQLSTYFTLLVDGTNFVEVSEEMLYRLVDASRILTMILPICIIAVLLIKIAYTTPNNYTQKTKPREAFERVERKVFGPIKEFVRGYVEHVREHLLSMKFALVIWLYNLNVITIGIELFAYFFYGTITFFEINGLYSQVVKLSMDLTVALSFLPWWVWAIIGYKILDAIRRKIGNAMLEHYEACNKAFLKLYLGALFIVGKQRTKKTTIITDMALTQEVIFREEAQERLAIRDKQFPFFPWERVELFYRESLKRHTLPTLASIREFFGKLKECFQMQQYGGVEYKAQYKSYRRHLKKTYGYNFDDFLFGYDWERYGLIYNDKLTEIHVFEAVEAYLQLFYIYAAPTSLIFGNYAIRTDLQWQDYGNYPILNADFFGNDPSTMQEDSQYSHVARLDNFRLYKVVNPADPYINGFEFGVTTFMEWAKERGNQNTNAGVKATDDNVNAKNDGFELNMKIQTHQSTIDNYTFFRLLMDDHRQDSLSADNKDLCDVIMVKNVSDARTVMPFYYFGELLYSIVTKIHDKIYYSLRNLRGDANNTLLVYLMKKLYNPIFRHHDRITKYYTVYTANLRIEDAMQKEVLTEKGKYYICMKKTYSDRFATDGLKQFYHQKALKSKYGLNDFPKFKEKHISVQEMEDTGSLFYKKIIAAFHHKTMQRDMLQNLGNKAKRNKG